MLLFWNDIREFRKPNNGHKLSTFNTFGSSLPFAGTHSFDPEFGLQTCKRFMQARTAIINRKNNLVLTDT